MSLHCWCAPQEPENYVMQIERIMKQAYLDLVLFQKGLPQIHEVESPLLNGVRTLHCPSQ